MDKRRSGFSIIELVVVLMVGSVLTSIAISSFNGVSGRFATKGARQTFMAMNARAQAQAVEYGRIVRLNLDPDGDSVWLSRAGEVLEVVDFREEFDVDIRTSTDRRGTERVHERSRLRRHGMQQLQFSRDRHLFARIGHGFGSGPYARPDGGQLMFRLKASGPKAGARRADAGFSLVELVMALFVLAFGVIGLATTTLFITRQLTLAEVTTSRVAAIQSVMERIRATPYDSIKAGGDTIGPLVVSWAPTVTTAQTKSVQIVAVGPGQASISETQSTPMLSSAVTDTVMYRVLRP